MEGPNCSSPDSPLAVANNPMTAKVAVSVNLIERNMVPDVFANPQISKNRLPNAAILKGSLPRRLTRY
jgi:hypothetical protein